jgi:hypothetical protein
MSEPNSGTIEVDLEREDVKQLLTHGTAVVQKHVGPLRIDIRCKDKLRTEVVIDGHSEGTEVLNDDND